MVIRPPSQRCLRWLVAGALLAVSPSSLADPAWPPADVLQASRVLRMEVDASEVASAVTDPDPLVRATVCRLLALHPDLEPSGALTVLTRDGDERVASLAILALSRSRDPTALSTLETELSAGDPLRRELSAIALHLRAHVGAPGDGDDLEPHVDTALLERSLTQISTAAGRAWLQAIADYETLVEAEAEWLGLQARYHHTQGHPDSGRCVRAALRNPALLLPPSTDDQPHVSLQARRRPDTVVLRRGQERPVSLLMSGQHDALSDALFDQLDMNSALARFIADLDRICSALPPDWGESVVIGTSEQERHSGERSRDLSGSFVLALGVFSHPESYRPASGGFVLGEDVELTFEPAFALRYRDAVPATAEESRRFSDGFELGLTLGGLISSQFFDDRSRPTGGAHLVVDTATPERTHDVRVEGWRFGLESRLSAGSVDLSRDVRFQAAPQVVSAVSARYYAGRLDTDEARPERSVGLDLTWVEHVLGDPATPVRDDRWLEPSLAARWLFGQHTRRARLGFRGDVAVRSSEEVDAIDAVSGNASGLLYWETRELSVDAWVGVGVAGDRAMDAEPEWAPVGGMSARVSWGTRSDVRISFAVELERRAANLGRLGYAGILDSAQGRLGLAFTRQMRDEIALRLFLDHAAAEATDDELGWAGFELYIPIGLMSIDQEITYMMRYQALIDSSRFGSAAQEVFEALLTAGLRF